MPTPLAYTLYMQGITNNQMKTYELNGYTYYFKDGILMASPSLANGEHDEENEMPVEDFEEPLTKEELAGVKSNLK